MNRNFENFLRREKVQAAIMQEKRPDNLEKNLADRGVGAPFVYDHNLFVTLNEIYKDKPLVPRPREISARGLFAQADMRIQDLRLLFGDINGLRCLEVGCGRGETALRLAEDCNCLVTGVDTRRYPEWDTRQNEATNLVQTDLTEKNPFAPESFDLIISFAVLEHVKNPFAMLEAIFALLKPGGRAYITANLYRGPMASHRYREVFFPWPHLLFADEIFISFYKQLSNGGGEAPGLGQQAYAFALY